MSVAIIGAGYAGLTAAYDLGKAGYKTTVYEALPQAGGLAMGFKAPYWEWPLEKFYHHLFTNDDAIISLTREIGIEEKLKFYAPRTDFVHNGKLYPFDNPIAALRYPGLSWLEKLRMGPVLLYLRRLRDWRPLEQVTAHDWMRRAMGSAYHKTWEPLLIGKFGEQYYRDVPLSWFWARWVKRTPKLGYFDGGFEAFTDALVRATEQHGTTLHLDTPVRAIRQREGAWEVESDRGGERFERVIVTLSPGLVSKLVPDLPEEYLASLRNLRSLGAIVMTVALSQPLTERSYWINLDKREYPMLALVEHTNMVDSVHYGGDHLIYLGDYLPADHPYFGYDADRLFDIYESALKTFNSAYDRSWVTGKWLFKATYAQPVPPLRYSEQIPPLRTPVEGLYFASMSQVYPWDRGTNYAVEMGHKVAATVLEDVGRLQV